jgi:hypothetical protein
MAAGHQIPFTQESISKNLTRAIDTSLVGAQSVPAAPVIAEATAGALTGRFRYEGLQRLILMALGFESPNGDDGSPRLIGTGEGTKVVTGATNATPIVISVATHGYSNGDGIQIAAVGGNTAANGDWSIANVTAGTFELVDSSGNGAYTSGGTAERYNAATHIFEGDETIQDQAWNGNDGRNPGFSANDRKVRRFQLGVAKQVNDHVYSSSFVNKLTIAGNPNEVTITADIVSYDRLKGSYNSASWTLPAVTTAQLLFQQAVISLGTRAGGEGGVSIVRPSSLELTIDNKLKPDDQTSASGVKFEQPLRDGHREVMLKLEFPRYNAIAEELFFDLDTEYCGKVVFTGPAISGTGETYLYGFFMSSLRWSNFDAAVSGPGRIPRTLEFFAEKPGGSDVFESGNYESVTLRKDSSLVVKVQNEDPQNYLTEY